jgi:abortive infection bacteriophage resistance protein
MNENKNLSLRNEAFKTITEFKNKHSLYKFDKRLFKIYGKMMERLCRRSKKVGEA